MDNNYKDSMTLQKLREDLERHSVLVVVVHSHEKENRGRRLFVIRLPLLTGGEWPGLGKIAAEFWKRVGPK